MPYGVQVQGQCRGIIYIEVGIVIQIVQEKRVLSVQCNGEINDNITHGTKVGWQKWRNVPRVLCDKNVSLKLKGKYLSRR